MRASTVGIGNLVAIQVQDRQHGAIGGRVQELVGMPGRGQRSGLRLAIADHAGDDEPGVVEHRTKGMAQRITKLTAFMYGARTFR